LSLADPGGIGAGIAKRLGEDGWTVAVHAHTNPARANEVHAHLRSAGHQAGSYVADLLDEHGVGQLFDDVVREFGDLDAVVSDTGIFPPPSWLTCPLKNGTTWWRSTSGVRSSSAGRPHSIFSAVEEVAES
jgi:3-oxoacyl-[acyl-carrier protein] reductase